MAGDAIDHATTALLEELVDFFPSGKRQVLAKALAKLKNLEAKAVDLATKRLEDPALDQRLMEAMEKIDLQVATPGS